MGLDQCSFNHHCISILFKLTIALAIFLMLSNRIKLKMFLSTYSDWVKYENSKIK